MSCLLTLLSRDARSSNDWVTRCAALPRLVAIARTAADDVSLSTQISESFMLFVLSLAASPSLLSSLRFASILSMPVQSAAAMGASGMLTVSTSKGFCCDVLSSLLLLRLSQSATVVETPQSPSQSRCCSRLLLHSHLHSPTLSEPHTHASRARTSSRLVLCVFSSNSEPLSQELSFLGQKPPQTAVLPSKLSLVTSPLPIPVESAWCPRRIR